MLTSLIWKTTVFLALAIGNFIIGVIPAHYINRNNDGKRKFFVSGLLCFGAGVLLVESPYMGATLRETIRYIISVGSFFLLYLANELYNYRRKSSSSNQSGYIYSIPLIRPDEILPEKPGLEPNVPNAQSASSTRKGRVHQDDALFVKPEQYRDEEGSFLSHEITLESNANSYVSHIALTLALIIDAGNHAAFMGDAPFDWLRHAMPSIFLRQFILAFWLGLELFEAYGFSRKHFIAFSLYSGVSCLGYVLGMYIIDLQRVIVDPLNYVAKGIIIYVALTEIFPRERKRWHNSPMRLAGLVQFFSVFWGYVFMNVAYNYIH